VRFLKHNIRDEFDDLTDVAAFYRVKSVPSFLFLVGGAQVTAPPFAHRQFPPSRPWVFSAFQLPSPAADMPAITARSAETLPHAQCIAH